MTTVRTEEVTLAFIPKCQPRRTQRIELKYWKGKAKTISLTCQTVEDESGYNTTTTSHLLKEDVEEMIAKLIEAMGEM